MKKLNSEHIACLLMGNSWFATGGGFPSDRAGQIFKKILKSKNLILKSLSEFNDRDCLCVASGVGSVKYTKVNITKESTKGIKIIEKIVGKRIKGIVNGEIGLECLAADTATKLNLPIVDADMKGGRAAPEPSINLFSLNGQSVLPIVAINTDGDIVILKNVSDPQKIEVFLRHFANMANGCFVAWCPRKVSDFKKNLIAGTVSRAIKIGEMISKKNSLKKIIKIVDGRMLFKGRVVKIKEEESKGFLFRRIIMEKNKKTAEIWIKNENLVVTINNKVRLTCPDLITIIDPKTNLGLHNSQITVGKEVIIIGIPINKKWHSKNGHRIFGPKHFQLPFEIKRI